MLKPKKKITIREENFVFFVCFVWYLNYGGGKNIIIIYVDFLLFLDLKCMLLVIIGQRKFGGVPLPLGLNPCPLFSLPTWKEEQNATTIITNLPPTRFSVFITF
jgi:hypothetical protein